MCPLGRERVYIDSSEAKGTDGGRNCKFVPNSHSSLHPQSQNLRMLAGHLAAGPKDQFPVSIAAIMTIRLVPVKSSYMDVVGASAEQCPSVEERWRVPFFSPLLLPTGRNEDM